jgi:hypothetical protein
MNNTLTKCVPEALPDCGMPCNKKLELNQGNSNEKRKEMYSEYER